MNPSARIPVLALAMASLSALVPAQVAVGGGAQAEADISTAYSSLAASTGIRLDVVGTQTDVTTSGQKTVIPIGGTLYYSAGVDSSGNPNIQVDWVETYNGFKSYELIGDGKNLWVYRPLNQARSPYVGTYSASTYGAAGPAGSPVNPHYMHDLMAALTLSVPSGERGSYAIRLIRELFATQGSVGYHSWIPMPIGPTEFASPNAYQDPITGLYADPSTGLENRTPPATELNTEYVLYASLPHRAIAFELSIAGASPTLNRIYYSEFQAFADRSRVTFWTITPSPTSNFSGARFTPYTATDLKGWQPLVGLQKG